MANVLYPLGKEAILSGGVNFSSDTITVTLLDSGYTYSAAHNAIDDIAVGYRVDSEVLGSKTITSGVFDAADTVFASLTGDPIVSFVIWKDTGVESTSTLIAFFDTKADSNPISYTPSGVNLTLQWNASGIIAL